jgi:hypothetical protein
MAQMNFDASQVAPNAGNPEPVPAGWYNAQIDESEMKPTKGGDGTYLQLRFVIVDGNYANRKVYARLNLRNANPVAQEIAYGELSAICHAVGVMQLQDSQQLHGQPMKIKLNVSPGQDGYDPSNNIRSYKNINEDVGGMGGQPAQTGGGVPQGFGNTQPQTQPAQQPSQPPQQPQQPQQPQAQQPWQQPQQPAQQPQPQPQPQQPAAVQNNAQQPAQPQPQAEPQPKPWEQNAQAAQPAQHPAPQQPAQPAQQPAAQQPVGDMPPWAQGQGQ